MKSLQVKLVVVIVSFLLMGTTILYLMNDQNPTDIKGETSSYTLLNFKSYEDFNTFLQSSSNSNTQSNSLGGNTEAVPRSNELDAIDTDEKSTDVWDADDYSSTNVQELGVDEADIVKSDGKYLYIVAGSKVHIISAYPAENAEILSAITFNESQTPTNLFINGDRIALITQSYQYNRLYDLELGDETGIGDDSSNETDEKKEETAGEDSQFSSVKIDIDEEVASNYDVWTDTTTTNIVLYDVTSKTSPALVREIQMEGYYFAGRMIGDYVYVITTHYTYEPVLYSSSSSYVPKIMVDNIEKEVGLSDIYYIDSPTTSETLMNIVSVDMFDETEDVTSEVFLLGDPSTVYVSSNAIYITTVNYNYAYSLMDEILETMVVPMLPNEAKNELDMIDSLSLEDYQKSMVYEWIISSYIEKLDDEQKHDIAREIVLQYEKTIIHKIVIENGSISYTSQGSVPGVIKNQFSLSEFQGNLRVATTVNGWIMRSYVSSIDSYNNVYVLNETLDVIGEIENIAEGEEIYSVRFLDNLCYLVTYKDVDPFFVINLEDPYHPQILGELKIPGYSTYLHPYDEDHVIGIGMENRAVKVSLFDVFDVTNPEELATYQVEEKTDEYFWMSSTALYEHKAFLFDKDKNLLILPISTDYIESAYVFDISLDGIELRGIISHQNEEQVIDNTSEMYEPSKSAYWGWDYQYSIVRSLYIEDVIYTLSNALIQMNDMDKLEKINSIDLL